ncbi:hypothetical protein RDABS01_018414 [Bienertia sinuspersici]
MAEDATPPIRLVNFVSQDELEQTKRSRGERVEDGTAQRDRPLFEILKENKDKKDAEFNERFKHRPPKALDDDETEFLENVEMSRKDYERKIADEEAEQLRSFQEKKTTGKKSRPGQPLGMVIKVKPQKKAKVQASLEAEPGAAEKPSADFQQHSNQQKTPSVDKEKPQEPLKNSDCNRENIHDILKTGLVSYSDGSDDDDY